MRQSQWSCREAGGEAVALTSTREGRHSDHRGYFEDVEEEMLTRAIYEVKSSGFVMEAVCG